MRLQRVVPAIGRAFGFLFSRPDGVGNHLVARWIFLRCLGGVYFSAFFALLFQACGLVGSQGVLPLASYLDQVQALGPKRFWFVPTVLWAWRGNDALMAVCWLGLLASILVLLNVLPRLSLLVCFVCFLSFLAVSQDFGQYQSDGMLLEAGFLALFVAPAGLLPGWGRRSLPVRAAMFLLLWEWFRIYFESGVVKLQSGDPTWRNFTAMYEYYQNGPLPTWVGWYLEHLPLWFARGTAAFTLALELGLVWMAFLPRRWRIACFCIATAWQAGVIATANYAFLNYLVLILGFLLLDDDALRRFVPARWRSALVASALVASESSTLLHQSPEPTASSPWFQRVPHRMPAVARIAIAAVALTWVGYSTSAQLVQMFWPRAPLPLAPIAALEPFRIANSYGLFATMTPHRYEIEFQGSNDGQTWTPYPFRYKPQDPRDRPRIYAPYQPRFDWNLWFASLGPWQQSPIVPLTEQALLHADKPVLGLFARNPFRATPPRYVRAVLWQYWFSTPAEKRAKGVWWRRRLLGTYAPTLTRLPDGRVVIVQDADLNGPPEM